MLHHLRVGLPLQRLGPHHGFRVAVTHHAHELSSHHPPSRYHAPRAGDNFAADIQSSASALHKLDLLIIILIFFFSQLIFIYLVILSIEIIIISIIVVIIIFILYLKNK